MRTRKFVATAALLATTAVGLVAAPRATAATKTTTYPTVCASMRCPVPLSFIWPNSVSYEGVTCTQPGVTCPTAQSLRQTYQGSQYGVILFSGTASVGATVTHSWIGRDTIAFVYNGAGGSRPDTVTFTIDRAATNQSLLDLGGRTTMSVYVDDLDAGTSLTIVDQRPVTNQPTFATDPTVSIDPNQLTMGHKYQARVVTRFSYPAGVLPDLKVVYRNFALTATAEDTDNDGLVDNSDNCPGVSNVGQENFDNDGQGDPCDDDDDNDTVTDASEAGCVGTTGSGDPRDTDSDDDGVLDGPDAFPCDATENADPDGDGVGNGADRDDDNDTLPDSFEAGCVGTTGSGDPRDTDSDDDGVLDGPDAFPCDATRTGAEGDGAANRAEDCPDDATPDQADRDAGGRCVVPGPSEDEGDDVGREAAGRGGGDEAGAGRGVLPFTGGNLLWLALLGAGLVGAGTTIPPLRRRRRA